MHNNMPQHIARGRATVVQVSPIYVERQLRTSIATDDRFGSNPATVTRLGDLYIALRWSTFRCARCQSPSLRGAPKALQLGMNKHLPSS